MQTVGLRSSNFALRILTNKLIKMRVIFKSSPKKETKSEKGFKLTNLLLRRRICRSVMKNVEKMVSEKITTKFLMDEQESISGQISNAVNNALGENQKAPSQEQKVEPKSTESTKKTEPRQTGRVINDDYTVKEAAKYLRIGESTFRKYQAEGKIEGSQIVRKWTFTKAQLDSVKTTSKTNAQIENEVEAKIIESQSANAKKK